MSSLTPTQAAALRELASMFIDAVKVAGPIGAPAGVMYAAVCDKLSLNQFNSITGGLVRAGKLRRDGDLFHFVADL
jgi:hypothetical protein